MPKQKHLTTRYTIRLSEYLSNEMIKHTLKSGQDYSSFVRMCIANYLKNKSATAQMSDKPMSATKTHNSGVMKQPSIRVEDNTPTIVEDTAPVDDIDTMFRPSLYGWD